MVAVVTAASHEMMSLPRPVKTTAVAEVEVDGRPQADGCYGQVVRLQHPREHSAAHMHIVPYMNRQRELRI